MKKFFLVSVIGLSVFFLGLAPVQATSLSQDMRRQSEAFSGEQGANLSARDPRVIVGELIKVALTLIGIIFVSYTVYGGFLIMTAAGNDERITKARSIITQGTIGVAVVLSSYSIAFLVYRFMLKANDNPFATFAGWNVAADDSGFYNTDPLEQDSHISNDLLPDDLDLPMNAWMKYSDCDSYMDCKKIHPELAQ